MHVGGTVRWLLDPKTPDELRAAYVAARERGFEVRVLGGGANTVIDDGELDCVVISTEKLRRIFRPGRGGDVDEELPPGEMVQDDPAEDPRLVAWAGASLPSVLRAARDLGYTGLEGLVGVPGHLGGGVAMNAGGRWGDMWDVIESVRVMDASGELTDLARAEHQPAYRNGMLGERIVMGAVLRFENAPKPLIQERMREYLQEKNRVQPVTEWSCGCVFKNPDKELADGRSAGQLIEEVGGKQLARGEAIVSPLHGNFIVNRGAATAADVFTLMEDVQDLVAQKTGIRLEFEVKRWRPERRR